MVDQKRTLDSCTPEESAVKGTQHMGAQRWVTINKAWNDVEGWMKSTKALELPYGVLVQVTTYERGNIAEALTYVPGVSLEIEETTGTGAIV